MRRGLSSLKLALFACLIAGTASAQAETRKALIMGLHGPGFQVPLSNSVALRADGSVSLSASQGIDNWTGNLGLSGVFYQSASSDLRTYVGPRIGYTYAAPSSGIAHTGTVSGSLFFGAEYSLGHRFGTFGEVGATYARTTGTRVNSQTNTAIDTPPINFASTFTGVGLLLKFELSAARLMRRRWMLFQPCDEPIGDQSHHA
jgi:hypothetical protein